MKIQALKFSGVAGKNISRIEFEVEQAIDLLNLKEREAPGALLVEEICVEDLAKFDDAVIDRRAKNSDIELSRYLLGKTKIPIVIGKYKALGSCQSSVWTLLKNATKKSERNLYVIGVDLELFQQLWDRIGDGQKTLGSGSGLVTPTLASSHGVAHLHGPNDPASHRIWQEMKDIKTPEVLSRKFVGESPEAELVRKFIYLAAQVDTPVLIMGDTGTGKEVVARAIHDQSRRRGKRLVTVNCSAIPFDLAESLLFGHEKGAFTGAAKKQKGAIEAADESTLFLDEIGDLQPWHQVKILRVIQEKTITPVGDTQEIPVDVRFVAATNRDLFGMMNTGRFRDDLYYRLRGILIRTPALRKYPEDIGRLAKFFWDHLNEERTKADPPQQSLPPLTAEIVQTLQGYSWPGNARELKMVLETLSSLFFIRDRGIRKLTVNHLNAVFFYSGQGPGCVTDDSINPELMLHKVECLRTLRRAGEIIHATQVTLAPLGPGESGEASGNPETVITGLGLRLNELEMVCQDPLYFHSPATFSLVNTLKGKLSYLQSLLPKNPAEGLTFYAQEITPSFTPVTEAVFQEVDKLFTEK